MSKRKSRSVFVTILMVGLLFLIGFFMALPLVYAVVSSFKPLEELFLFPPRFFVRNPTLENYQLMGHLISNMWIPFERYLFNTVLVSVISTAFYLIIVTLAAYPLAKHEFVGKRTINNAITLALMFTTAVIGLPQYVIMAKLGVVNTYAGMILPLLANTMGVYLCVQYLDTIPSTIIESARIDGAGEYKIWWRIILPNTKPAIMTIMIFQFQHSWNQTAGNIVYSENLKLLPVAINQISSAGIARAGIGSAASVLMMIPPIIMFVISQSRVMETMAHSGMKD